MNAVPPLRRAGTLADGRQIIYFDDRGSVPDARWYPDQRSLPPVATAGEMRLDPLTGDWVALASHRMERTFLPPDDECPLCPSKAGAEGSEVPAPMYDVVVFENRFPSFSALCDSTAVPELDRETLFPRRPASGRTEVVCFTSRHDGSFAELSPLRVRTVFDAWADRTRELSALPGVEQVFCFENRGAEIGVTLAHPHGQVYAYPFVPPRTSGLLRRAQEHRAATGGDLLADVLAAERRSGRRVVLSGTHWTAYVPAAARWPVEVHVTPHRALPDLAAMEEDETAELAEVYLDLLRRLDRFHGRDGSLVPLPYIAGWHAAPVGKGRELLRLQLQITSVLRAPGKLKYLAGSETAMGAFINDTTPERVADRLVEVGRG